ncbi:MAG: hypothetical protein AB1439_05675 [candidate division FCPU426 bacterium]
MLDLLYRASFFLYEVSFLLFAAALVYHALAVRKINLALKQRPYWIGSALGAVALVLCAYNHYHVYHTLSPLYLQNESRTLLLRMYQYKTWSMFYILAAGLGLTYSTYAYVRTLLK